MSISCYWPLKRA